MALPTRNEPQTLIHKKAGQEVHKEFFEIVQKNCPTVFGFAVNDTSLKTLEVERFNQAVTVDNLMELNSQTKGYDAIFYMANLTSKFEGDDIQPYELMVAESADDEKGKVILSWCVEGDFPKYVDEKSGHTDQTNFSRDIIVPT